MARVKQVAFYGILIVVFAIFSNYIIKIGLKSTYNNISGKVKITAPEITMTEVKTTDVNGYAKGTIKNNLENDIDRIYIKIDLFSKRDVNLGTKYLEINNLASGEIRDFQIDYRFSNVSYYEITCVYEK